MRVAVTGATGFLGGYICEALLAAAHEVRGLSRSPEKASWLGDAGVEMVPADLGDREALERGLRGVDALVSNAAMGSRQGSLADVLRVNVEGTERLLRAAAAQGVTRVILISSTSVYRTRVCRFMGEDAEPYGLERRWLNVSDLSTDWRYALSKSRSEALAWSLAAELDLDMTALRPGPIYGPRDVKATARFTGALKRRVVFAPTVGVPFVHAGDVAATVPVALARRETAGRRYNLAGPPVSPFTMIQTLKTLAGRGPVVIPVPIPLWVGYRTEAAERELDFANRSFEVGLAELALMT